jgi:hypothetical protein
MACRAPGVRSEDFREADTAGSETPSVEGILEEFNGWSNGPRSRVIGSGWMHRLRGILPPVNSLLRWTLLAPPLGAAIAWACAALYFDGPLFGWLAAAFGAAAVVALGFVRPLWKSVIVVAVLFLAVVVWWLSLEPSNDRQWLPDVARLPTAEIDGDRVTIHNVRNFVYRSEFDYDEHWEERTYDLSKLQGVDLFLIYWGSPWIAHTIMSWVFGDGPPLAISIETRKEVGESYSAVRGFFRQFELYYVVSDERDVIRLRTDFRGEQVFLYHLIAKPEVERKVLLAYLDEINRLARKPRWYNALRYNCTTAIRHHVQSVTPGNPFDWRILVNGRLDELGYERGTIDQSLPFDELRRRSDITERAKRIEDDADFSRKIREGLPGRLGATPRADATSPGRPRS